jgi:uncharacterized protein YndB with AHSA1/START domain
MATRSEPAPAGWTVLQVRRTFDAPREALFQAWLDPDLLHQWLTGIGTSPGAEVDPRVGGEFRITMTRRGAKLLARLLRDESGEFVHLIGRYQEISPPEKLVFTMGWQDFPTVHMDRDASTVTVEFNERAEGTEMVLTHERQPSRRIRSFHRMGWRGSFKKLDRLLSARYT